MFACAVPCYAETSNEDNFCISGISPLYELADTANAYLSISGTTASCQASDGVSGITVVQTLPKHKEQMILKEFQINEYNNGDILFNDTNDIG